MLEHPARPMDELVELAAHHDRAQVVLQLGGSAEPRRIWHQPDVQIGEAGDGQTASGLVDAGEVRRRWRPIREAFSSLFLSSH